MTWIGSARFRVDILSAERRGRAAMAVASAKGSLAHQRKAEALLAGDLSRL